MSEQIETAAELSAVFDAWYNARNPQSVKNVGGRTVKVASFDETYGLANGVMNLFNWAEAQEKRIDALEAANAAQAKTIESLENRPGLLADNAAETRRMALEAARQPAPVPTSESIDPASVALITADFNRLEHAVRALITVAFQLVDGEQNDDGGDFDEVAKCAAAVSEAMHAIRYPAPETASQPAPVKDGPPARVAPIAGGLAIVHQLHSGVTEFVTTQPEVWYALVRYLKDRHPADWMVRVVIYPADEVQP